MDTATRTPAWRDGMGLDELAANTVGGRVVRRGDQYAIYHEPPMSIEGALNLDEIDALEFVSRHELRSELMAMLTNEYPLSKP